LKKLIFSVFVQFFVANFANAQNPSEQFEKIISIIGSDRIFNYSYDQIIQQLDGVCKKSTRPDDRAGNVECVEAADVKKFNIVGSGDPKVTMINVSFVGADKCTYFKDFLTKKFGKPKSVKSNCEMDWVIKSKGKGLPRRYIGFQSVPSKDKTLFEIGEEQGP
jgi:hypothetical protein